MAKCTRIKLGHDISHNAKSYPYSTPHNHDQFSKGPITLTSSHLFPLSPTVETRARKHMSTSAPEPSRASVCSRAFARFAGSNPARGMDSVPFEYCVLSGRSLCIEPIDRPKEFYPLCCVTVFDLETSNNEASLARVGLVRHKKSVCVCVSVYIYIYIYISLHSPSCCRSTPPSKASSPHSAI